jgi:hypothetical protein
MPLYFQARGLDAFEIMFWSRLAGMRVIVELWGYLADHAARRTPTSAGDAGADGVVLPALRSAASPSFGVMLLEPVPDSADAGGSALASQAARTR